MDDRGAVRAVDQCGAGGSGRPPGHLGHRHGDRANLARRDRSRGVTLVSQLYSPVRRWTALGVLALATLLVMIEITALALAMPYIAADLRPEATAELWIGDAYAFMMAGTLVTMGTLADRVGRKKLLLLGATCFGLLSFAAAFAPTAGVLIAVRALMGLAAATLMPPTLSLIRNIFTDPRERVVAMGVWAAMISAGMGIGPLASGVLLEHFWWGSVFLIKVPVIVPLVIVGALVIPESRNPAPGPWDLPSVALSIVGIVGVVYAMKQIASYGVGQPVEWAAAVGGIGVLMLFARRQRRLCTPLIDIALFAKPRFSGAVLANVLTAIGITGVVYFIAQYLQMVQGATPLSAGLQQLPMAVCALLASLLAGRIATHTSARAVVSGAVGLVGLGLAGLAALSAGMPYVVLAVLLGLLGIGMGLASAVTTDVIVTSVRKEEAGAASAISETGFELGAALGIAIFGTILTATYRGTLTVPVGLHPDTGRDSLGNALAEAANLPAGVGEQLTSAARDAYISGLQLAHAVSAVLLFGCAAACWFMLRDRVSERRSYPRR
ncbi:MAG: MFS transporter [Pseudonocardiaceae bacterium]|nr:MFS transporter [Pseudonocardiaceae bacterium]